jgi:hypothetical protein
MHLASKEIRTTVHAHGKRRWQEHGPALRLEPGRRIGIDLQLDLQGLMAV